MKEEPRTVVLATLDHGDVILPEPAWCVGHADHRPDSYRVDLCHTGSEHQLTHDGELLWTASLGQAPCASRPQGRTLGVYVAQDGYARTLDPSACTTSPRPSMRTQTTSANSPPS
ncbi:DUF6907 domain-containing protein [Streptomyces antibioticus]|uniref:DUF6907 domain-containing protein n=1 Tax=Streptomyces antibioticus TaxID=1890 RepID=UPI0036B26372